MSITIIWWIKYWKINTLVTSSWNFRCTLMLSKSKKQTRMEAAYRFIRSTLSNYNRDRSHQKNINIENQCSFVRIKILILFLMAVHSFTVTEFLFLLWTGMKDWRWNSWYCAATSEMIQYNLFQLLHISWQTNWWTTQSSRDCWSL